MPKLKTIFIPVAGFIIILVTLNGYQYFKLRSNLTGPIIKQISAAETRELQSFFDSVASKLKIVRGWARNGILNSDDIISLNKKFIPLIEHQTPISGVLLADNQGHEYYLYPENEFWTTRIRSADRQNSLQYQRWQKPDKSIKQWQKESNYSPEQRPWFKRTEQKDSINWTPIYTFYEKNIPGISASVSWDIEDRAGHFAVFALDIGVQELQKLLKRNESISTISKTTSFLVNPFSGDFIPADYTDSSNNTRQPLSSDHIAELISQWKAVGKPADQIVRLQNSKQQMLATFKPMLEHNSVIWLGVAASEKELLTDLNKALFAIDMVDLLVAGAGAGAMLLLVWLNGGLRSAKNAEQEDPVLRVHRLINQGEGNNIEFKSTVRMNLKSGKQGKEIEFAWLKAVIAFLNSDGGTLLIGVADNGKILGLEADNFENDDRCLLHIKNLFNHHVGAEFSDFANINLLTIEDNKVVTVDCRTAGEPVFLKIGKNEEFYIRSGPSNSKLTPSQIISYVQQKK